MYSVFIYSFCIYVCVSLEGLKHHVSLGAVTFFRASYNASQASEHFPYIKRTRGKLPDTKRLHKGIPRVIRSLADLASVKRISFIVLLYGYTFCPSHSVNGRTLFHYIGEFMKILLRAKGCIRSAAESRGSDRKGGRHFK